jgi:hypothetical protein
MSRTADLAKLKIGDFSPHLNTAFEIQMPDGKTVPVKLAEAVASGAAAPPAGLKGRDGKDLKAREGGGFMLQFVSPDSSRLTQGTYAVKHPKLGTLHIFLVPNGPGPHGYGYHAVFG